MNISEPNEKPVVSVIIPTYNRADYLLKCIFSVQKQTVNNIEILVCDDGSTDGTHKLVEELAKQDHRIRYIACGHNGWPAIPRNKGIQQSRGEWIAFVDDDDLWNPPKLEAQLFELKKYGKKACCTNAFCYEDGINTGKKYFTDHRSRIYSYRDLVAVNPIICSSMMIHRSLLEKCPGFPENENLKSVGEDYAYWCRISALTDIVYLDQPLTGYLVASESSIRLRKEMTFEEQRFTVDQSLTEWLSEHREFERYYRKERAAYRRKSFADKITGPFLRVYRRLKRLLK